MPSAGSSTRCVLCLPLPPLSQWRVESSLNTDRAPVFYCCGGWGAEPQHQDDEPELVCTYCRSQRQNAGAHASVTRLCMSMWVWTEFKMYTRPLSNHRCMYHTSLRALGKTGSGTAGTDKCRIGARNVDPVLARTRSPTLSAGH
jgi:hypothetical protein